MDIAEVVGSHPWEVAAAVLALLWLFLGRFLSPLRWLRHDPNDFIERYPSEFRKLERPDGASIHIELCGPVDGLPLVLTHGNGDDGTSWHYVKNAFGDRCRLIIWDMPGFGQSDPPVNHDVIMERLAADLNAVLELAEGRPAILVGHSLGGMLLLTFCRLFPERLRTHVSGLVIAHAAYRNPVYSLSPMWLMPYLQKPLLEPLCRCAIAASVLFRLLLKLSYLSGYAHWHLHRQFFAGTETRGQLDGAAWYAFKTPVRTVARNTLAMFRFDETSVLSRIQAPVLVVTGAGDLTTAPRASQFMVEHLPNSELVVLSPARHFGIFERHEEFSEALRRFLEKVHHSPHPEPRG